MVLQFEYSESRDKAEENWPEELFSAKEYVHRPTWKRKKVVGYIRNIDPRLSEKSISNFLDKDGLSTVSVRRQYHRESGKPKLDLKKLRKLDLSQLNCLNLMLRGNFL